MPYGATRPGGRTARVRDAVLTATDELLDLHGYSGLSLERIALRAEVHLATVRRRWGSVNAIVGDLLTRHSVTLPAPDTGDLRQDLHELARVIAAFHGNRRNRNLLEGIIAGAALDPSLGEVIEKAFASRTEQVTGIIHRAISRGELPAGTDATGVIAALSAPFYYRLLITRQPVDDELAHTSAECAYHAARAGVFREPALE
ncbi:TetR-like C-terminal domain-containing protein [Streptomyces chattanoogensis]|uniref:TetR-like C-terminal domain-containing protein n=1 Tax=Streptomyces chattanoogensis TaxID=66876 RepID=UPI0036A8E8E6